ncbi:MAG: AAA family ATPase [Euryarchaeota archaeon]|nr:AAA family ATPase [Euryarchaeota archaeon]
MRFTISGPPGSGKTTVAKLLSSKLNYPLISGGMIFRQMAKEMGMDLVEFSRYAEEHPEVDYRIDEELVRRAKELDNVVVDSRLAGWMLYRNGVPAFKIYIDAPEHVRAERIQKRDGGEFQEVLNAMLARQESEIKRYIELYGVDYTDTSVYDLVLDSANMTPEEIVSKILEALQ